MFDTDAIASAVKLQLFLLDWLEEFRESSIYLCQDWPPLES